MAQQQQLAIGIDIGGTKIACALVDSAGVVIAEERLSTDPNSGAEATLDRIAEGVRGLLPAEPIAGIGIGCPGHVDPASGIVRDAVNLGWREVHLRDGLRQRLNLPAEIPIHTHKDANAAALGEQAYGVAQGYADFIYIAVGTGLGAGAVVNNQLVIGSNAYAMEIGHLALNPDGRLCECGLRGCPEAYVSGMGLAAGLREHAPRFPQSTLPPDAPTADLLAAARAGDALARTVIAESVHWLATVMGYCAVLFNPSLFILGGGLGHAAADLLLVAATQQMRGRVLPATKNHLQVLKSQVQSSAVGAASLVWHG